ncbi:MFS transporter [Rhodobacter ferrooxidans]|uniref:Major facilitator superfamily MFS_1 n=1 Tax=Rhodobacter ferrooxidans TaxID=371731 RepID=C8RWS7_9RHOB|nr:MFS transporter [Rhodobacter sp. SW2]EEW27020.1 major facilitator superfamily MFS_1 [Rhodobacter sp. SW2]
MISPRKRIWGWYFFDWASQPYSTLLLTFIFGPYFAEMARARYVAQGMTADAAAAAAQSYWGWGIAAASAVIALLAPLLGAIADGTGGRLVWVWVFSLLYVVGSYGLWWLAPGEGSLFWAVAFFGLGFIGMEFATIFTNALLPGLEDHDKIGGISGSGFAFGYLGGIVSLAVMLALFVESGSTGKTLIGISPILGLDAAAREGTRAVGPFTAIWYVVFMLPFVLWVREPKTHHRRLDVPAAWASLKTLLKSLAHRPSLAAYLGSSLLYRDALNALYGFGGVYASGVLGWSVTQIGLFGIVGAISAAVASWIGGRADNRFGSKPVISFSILVLIAVCCIIVGMTREGLFGMAMDPASNLPDQIFFACGALIGGAGGMLQAASRTMMVRHTSPEHAAEAFGLFALSGKVTSFLAPALIAAVTMASGSQRIGISPLIGLFLAGLFLLVWVKPQGEQRVSA